MTRHRRLLGAFALTTALASPALSQSYTIEPLAEGLNQPWALAFLPGTPAILLTGRTGQIMLWVAETGAITAIDGAPEVDAGGQGGLLDIAPAPDFEQSALVYLTWSAANDAGETATHLGRARLDRDAARLNDLEVLHAVEPFMNAPGHYGSRITFAGEHLYFSTGDRQQKDFGPEHIAQDRSNGYGSILRLNLDGSLPPDNPFADDEGAAPEIWSFGHRNIQAMGGHPQTGAIWVAEHGEAGGDEINIVERAGNYGWPLVSHGVDYRTGEPFAPEHAAGDSFIAPVFHFGPGRADNFPPSGMAFYEGAAFPEWRDSLLVGNLAHQYLGRFPTDDETVSTPERLLEGQGWRIRDVAVGPQDGFVYVISDGEGAVLARLVPATP